MAGKGPLTINEIVKKYLKPDGGQYSPEGIRKVLVGKKGGKGLIDKVPGMLTHKSIGDSHERGFEIPRFDDKSDKEIVSLKGLGDTTSEQSKSADIRAQ